MKGVLLNKEQLLKRFPISNRLALRVGALQAKGVLLSEAVLETAKQGNPLEAVLIHQEVFKHADKLDTAFVQKLAAEMKADAEGALVVTEDGTWKVVALEEELLADQAWKSDRPEAGSAQLAVIEPTATPLLEVGEASRLFTAEEIARLKLTALTSADASEKIAAMRKLMYAPITDREKGAVFLRVLVDPISPVRAEAVKGLESLGFNHEIAEAVRMLLEDDEKGKTFAVQRIGAILGGVGEMEAQIVMNVLLQVMRESESAEMHQNVMRALRKACPALLANKANMTELARICMKQFIQSPDAMSASVRGLFTDLADHAPEPVAELLWNELRQTEDHRARIFLMMLIGQMKIGDDLMANLAQAMVDEILNTGLREDERVRLRYGLMRVGKAAVTPLLDKLRVVQADQQSLMVRLLDTLCMEKRLDAPTKRRVGTAFLDLLKVGERRTRRAVLQSRLCAEPELDQRTRRGMAVEFVRSLSEFRLPDTVDRIELTLEAIGGLSLEPLLEFAKKHANTEQGDRCIRAFARIVGAAGLEDVRHRVAVSGAINFCLKQLDERKVHLGGFAVALSQLCAAGATDEVAIDGIAKHLLAKLWKVPYAYDVLEALGILGGSDAASLECKVGITHELTRVLELEPPKDVGTERKTDDGIIYEFGREVEFDTVVLPAVIKGLERICLAKRTTKNLRETIVMKLLDAWGKVSGYKVVWSPLSVETVASALGKIGCHPGTALPYRIHIGRILRHQINRLSVVRSIGEMLRTGEGDPELDELAIEVGYEIVEQWTGPEVSPEERGAVIHSLACIASVDRLDAKRKDVRALRERVIELLYEGLRDNLPNMRPPLEMMRDCKGITKTQRRELDERIQKAFGLVKR